MRRILVINSKGGCGKTTVATNLASLYASRGMRTSLFDYDPQASSYGWLEQRPQELAPIHGVAAHQRPPAGLTRSWCLRIPPETERLVVDTAAAVGKPQLLERVKGADLILVPVVPAAIDARAAVDFINELLTVRKYGCVRIGIVINRIRGESRRLAELERVIEDLDLPLVTRLHDNYSYVEASDRGRGLHELGSDDARLELPSWQQILGWLEEDDSVPLPTDAHAQALQA
jgi:chromosome partitioning protein